MLRKPSRMLKSMVLLTVSVEPAFPKQLVSHQDPRS